MARTAPVPNFAAIPGMNPGIFVMGGGGNAGGSGAGGGKGKGGKQGADGKNGGKDAQGGGKDAGACGAGSADQKGCPNHHGPGQSGSLSAGDPVDVVTGEVFTAPVADVALPGPLPLDIVRAYRSGAAERDVGLGWGWTHGLSWRVEERRRSLIVHTFDGHQVRFAGPIPPGTALLGPHGWLLHRDGPTCALEIPDGRRYLFELDPAEPAGGDFRLARIVDRSDNGITLEYDPSGLARVIDSVGRVVHVRRSASGRIAAWEMILRGGEALVLARFRHDGAGGGQPPTTSSAAASRSPRPAAPRPGTSTTGGAWSWPWSSRRASSSVMVATDTR